MKRIAVIGAGISGLTTANLLKNRYTVKVFEKESYLGGLVHCEQINDSLFHVCGGHVFNSKRQDVLDWFWNIFSRDDEFCKTDRNSVVFMKEAKGGIIPYPVEDNVYYLDEIFQKRVINDYLSIALRKGEQPSNFEDFLIGKFGRTLYDLYFQPYNEKVWRRNLKKVPLSWLEGKLPMPTVEEMLYNNFNHIKEKSFVHSVFWYEKEKGSQYIVDKLAKGLDIVLNTDVCCIDFDGTNWKIQSETFDKIVFCGNIKDMIRMIKGINVNDFKQQVDKLEYHGTTAVFCEIDKNPFSWIYQPSRNHESHRIICTGNFSSSNNSSSLPSNRITASIEFTDQIDKDRIIENLQRIPLHPTYITHRYNRYTYPIQDANTRSMIKQLKMLLSPYGFFFTGRFADWEYYNMDVAMGAAIDLCKNI